MKYIKQIMIIFSVSLLGEVIKEMIKLPIPSSVYGLVILLSLLISGIIKKEDIKDVSNFLIETMPIMFIPPAINLIEVWPSFKSKFIYYIVIIICTTLFVMIMSGKVTEIILTRGEKND